MAQPHEGIRAMGLKQAIIEGMKVKQLRKAARKLNVPVESYREKESLVIGLGKSRRATAEALFEFLSEKDVKRLCDRHGVDSKGRRQELIARLSRAKGTASATEGNGSEARRSGGAGRRARRHRGKAERRLANPAAVPDLQFGISTDQAGFTPAGIAAFSDLRPAAVVRELIQNSLDAALIDAAESRAYVRFERSSCTLDDIPGIDSYRSAFRRAVEEQLPSGSARAVVERIERTLGRGSHDVLSVTDNGVGLDGKRMAALLSDGVSAKSGNASGTFGNGHSVVVPTSNLRYVLYGGLTENGESYGAGQAVLASHRVAGELWSRSGRGVYLESFQPSAAGVPFTLARGEAVPTMVASAIERIRSEHGHGAAVIIPAFNKLRARAAVARGGVPGGRVQLLPGDPRRAAGRPRWRTRSPAASWMRVRCGKCSHHIATRCARAGRVPSSPDGKANEAYETLVDGESHEIATAQGYVAVRLLRRETGRRTVGLCRNGMWITDELPMFQNAFSDRQPFQALILLNSDHKGPFFDLIQDAETPLHDKLALKQMDPVRRNALREALREIRDRIAELVPASAEDVYTPEDILAFQFEDVEGQGRGGRQPSFWGRVGSTRRPMMEGRKVGKGEPGGPGQGGGGGGRKRPKGRIVVEPIFRIASVPTGNGKRTVHVECAEDFEDAELRMFVDENVDATCDRQNRAQAAAVLLSNVMVDGRPLAKKDLVRNGDGAVGAKLGSLAANARTVVETDYAIPAGTMRLLPGQDPTLRFEVLSSREITPKDTGEADGGALADE